MKIFLKITAVLLLLPVLFGCGAKEAYEVPDANGDGALTCTLEVRCDVLLENPEVLPKEKIGLVPKDGILLPSVEVTFTAGESAFDVLRRVLREEKIHFEYVDASAYDTVYIEGIGNIYEYDCGSLSGWMYSVNDVFPGLGCSSYILADGDAVSFRYTCDMGEDLGAERVQ